MVTFTRIPYKQCLELRRRQDKILKILRLIGYSIIGLYLLKLFVIRGIKPLAIPFILSKLAADQTV